MGASMYKQDSYAHTWNKSQIHIPLVGILLQAPYAHHQSRAHTPLTPHGSYTSLPANPATRQAHSGSRVYALVLCTWFLLPSSQPFAQLKYLSYELPPNSFSSGMSRSDQPLKLQSLKLCFAFLAACTATWNATVWVFSPSFSFSPEWKLQRISTLCPVTGNDCSVQ